MCGVYRPGHRSHQLHTLLLVQSPVFQSLSQRTCICQFQNQKGRIVFKVEFQKRHDVGVLQLRQNAGFPGQATDEFGRTAGRMQTFHGNLTATAIVDRQIDTAHGSMAQQRKQPQMSQSSARRKPVRNECCWDLTLWFGHRNRLISRVSGASLKPHVTAKQREFFCARGEAADH
jgi:hypothetical protein